MTFPVSVQDKQVNALLDTGVEKSCMSMDLFGRLKLSLNALKVLKLRNASGRDMVTHGVMTVKFQMGNTIFSQELVVCNDLVRPMIIRRDFTVNNFLGIAWTRQGMKKITQDNKLVIEIEEPMRQRTLISTRKVAILPRSYAVFDLECEELEGKYKIKPNPFLIQGEPNIWIDNFVLYNTSKDKKNEVEQMKMDTPHQEVTEDTKDGEDRTSSEGGMEDKGEPKKVHVPYCIYNLSYEHHSYIPKGKVVAFAEKEEGENELFDVEEVTSVEGYRNWVSNKKGFLPVLPKSDFICSPAEVSVHRKVKLQSKPVMEDTIQQFEELCECFPEVFSKNSEDIGRTNLITMDIDTGDHPPPPTICQKPYTLALKYYEWVQKEVDQLEWMGIITRSVSPWASPIVIVPKKLQMNCPGGVCVSISED